MKRSDRFVIVGAVGFIISFSVTVCLADATEELFSAVKKGDIVGVKSAINRGAAVNGKDWVGDSPLEFAARYNRLQIAKILIESGADVNITDKFNSTPLFSAARGGYFNMVQLLMANGADVKHQDSKGDTADVVAAYHGHLNIERLLNFANRSHKQIVDLSGKSVSDAEFRDAAKRAFGGRGWTIRSFHPSHVEGDIFRHGRTYKATISRQDSKILIRYQRGYGAERPNYMLNLKKDIQRALGMETATRKALPAIQELGIDRPWLTADEVKTLLSGKTAISDSLTKSRRYITYYAPDGRMGQDRDGERIKGSWWVKDNGKHCIEKRDPISDVVEGIRCRFIVNKRGRFRRYKGKKGRLIRPVQIYKKFIEGNPYGL